MPAQLRFPCTFPTMFNVLNPPCLMGLVLKHTTLCQMPFHCAGNASCCCLNILLCFGGVLP